MAKNLLPILDEYIERALTSAAPGEEVEYSANFSVMGSPSGQPVTVLLLLLHIRALEVNEWITSVVWISSPRPTENEIKDAVESGISEMLTMRSKQAQEALATTNGHGHGHSHGVPDRLRGAIDLTGGLP